MNPLAVTDVMYGSRPLTRFVTANEPVTSTERERYFNYHTGLLHSCLEACSAGEAWALKRFSPRDRMVMRAEVAVREASYARAIGLDPMQLTSR